MVLGRADVRTHSSGRKAMPADGGGEKNAVTGRGSWSASGRPSSSIGSVKIRAIGRRGHGDVSGREECFSKVSLPVVGAMAMCLCAA